MWKTLSLKQGKFSIAAERKFGVSTGLDIRLEAEYAHILLWLWGRSLLGRSPDWELLEPPFP